MKVFWKFAPTALAVVALGLGLVQTVRMSRLKKQAVTRPQTAAKVDAERLARLEKRIASLERATRRLVGLALTRGGGRTGSAGPDPVLLGWLKNEVKSLRDDVDSVIAGEKLATPEGKKKLKDLLRKVQQEDRTERRQRWRAVADYMQKQMLNRFREDAKVAPATVQKIGGMLSDERQKLQDLWKQFRSGELDVPVAVAKAKELLDGTDRQAQDLLSSSQYKKYEEMRDGMPMVKRLRTMAGGTRK